MASGTRVRRALAVLVVRTASRAAAPLRAVVGLVAAVGLITPAVVLASPGVAGAQAAATPLVRLLYETATVSHRQPLLHLSLTRTGPALRGGATVRLTLFPRLTTRSALDASLTDPGAVAAAVSTSGPLLASCLTVAGQLRVAVPVAPDGTMVHRATLCGAKSPVLRLGCSTACDGVYPLRISVRGGGLAASLVTLVTYAVASATPLRVVWLVRVANTTSAATPATLAQSSGALRAVASHPGVPVTVDVEGSAIAAALAASSGGGTSGGAESSALRALHAIAGTPRDELVGESYVPADLGALRASGLRAEVRRQYALDGVVLDEAGVRTPPSRTVTYPTGPVTPTSVDALAAIGFHHVLLDGGALASDPTQSLAWGYAFRLSGAPKGPSALASDTELSLASDATSADPGLSASQLLGELAFLHFEAPDLPSPRAALVVTDATAQVTQAFADAVLSGLTGNPVLMPRSASAAFAEVPVGTSGFPAVRALALGPSTPLNHTTSSLIGFLRTTTDALSSAVTAGQTQTPIPAIEGDLLTAEQVLPGGERTAMLDHVHYLLEQQLGHFRIYNGTITLTEAGATLPITVFSNAPYTIDCSLVLKSTKLVFPPRRFSTVVHVTLSGVSSVRVAARALVTGDLPMTAILVSPDGRLVLTHALITVRATGTSVVGVVLTVLALVVLALWWLRTSRKRRRVAR